jgi:NAD(P)-dependent dehydrogenase (short-subunit alcohol dehydrogenase family)
MTAAFVTGAGGGIGRAVALRFARAGSAVTVVDIDPARGEETAALIREAGEPSLFVQADVADGRNVGEAVRATVAKFGGTRSRSCWRRAAARPSTPRRRADRHARARGLRGQ